MEYLIVFDRPLVDDEILEMIVPSKEDAAEGIAFFILLESAMNPDFKLISQEMTEDTLIVKLASGTIKAYPNVDKRKKH